MQTLIQKGVELGYFSHIDYYFAKELADDSTYMLLLALLSKTYGDGHTMIPLHEYLFIPQKWFGQETLELKTYTQSLLEKAHIYTTDDWELLLKKIQKNPNYYAPIVLSNYGVYLEKNYQYETAIINFFTNNNHSFDITNSNKQLLQLVFPNKITIDYQKLAAVNTLSQLISVIAGGPGTGKTTTVAKILFLLLSDKNDIKIMLSAPTGKASSRLTESIISQKKSLKSQFPQHESIIDKIPSESTTLHRLLGITPFSDIPKFYKHNPLKTDVLIIDEASMIDLRLFYMLISAISHKTRVIILGDKDQLSSVEAGAVLAEICNNYSYTPQHLKYLGNFFDAPLNISTQKHASNYLSMLIASHRFDETSGIGSLAKSVNLKNTELKNIFTKFPNELSLKKCQITDILTAIKPLIIQYHKALTNNIPLDKLFGILHSFKILCTTNTGSLGTEAINTQIQMAFFHDHSDYFYHGQPIIILTNSYEHQLFNGDIGIILKEGLLFYAYFEQDQHYKKIPVQILPNYASAFALTIHKSQGSEFEHVFLVIPESQKFVITKELLYTGITRAKSQLEVFSSITTLEKSAQISTERFSGIADTLKNG